MDSETKNSEGKKKYRKIPINNPFIRDQNIWDRKNELYDKVKVSVAKLICFVYFSISIILLTIDWLEDFLLCVLTSVPRHVKV